MITKNLLIGTIVIIGLSACSSKPLMPNGQKFEKDQILSTASNKSMPDWAEIGETQPFRVDDGKVYSVGITQILGDERPEAAARVATNNAYANISKHVSNKTEFILQNSEENFSHDGSYAKFIGSEVSSITSHEFTNEGVWWKRYATTQSDGSRKVLYKVYSLVTLPESKLKLAVHKAIEGKHERKLSEGFQKQIDRQWSRFVEGDKVSPETRTPSSSDSQE